LKMAGCKTSVGRGELKDRIQDAREPLNEGR
jgi:hypothetical protein